MIKFENGRKKIEIVNNQLCINIEALKEFIIKEWLSGELHNFYYNQGLRGELLYRFILSDIDDFVDGLSYELMEKAQKKLNIPNGIVNWLDKYPKFDIRSIGFEVLEKLHFAGHRNIENITTDDIPAILEFLDTPENKTLEAWEKWEKYWKNLDYEARRKKLLGEE